MLVGNAGVGKTILVSDKVSKQKEDFMVAKVPFNYYTTSAMLQRKSHRKECKCFGRICEEKSFLVILIIRPLPRAGRRCAGETAGEESWS